MRGKVVLTSWGFQEFRAWVLCFQLVCRTFLSLAKEQLFNNRGLWFLGTTASISPLRLRLHFFWLIWLPILRYKAFTHFLRWRLKVAQYFSRGTLSYEAWWCYVKSKFFLSILIICTCWPSSSTHHHVACIAAAVLPCHSHGAIILCISSAVAIATYFLPFDYMGCLWVAFVVEKKGQGNSDFLWVSENLKPVGCFLFSSSGRMRSFWGIELASFVGGICWHSSFVAHFCCNLFLFTYFVDLKQIGVLWVANFVVICFSFLNF